jgi:hypothetical protein
MAAEALGIDLVTALLNMYTDLRIQLTTIRKS